MLATTADGRNVQYEVIWPFPFEKPQMLQQQTNHAILFALLNIISLKKKNKKHC